MKKFIRKVLAGVMLFAIVGISGLAALILFPEPLFAHELKYKQFKIYSDKKLNDNVTVVLDRAFSLVERAEIYDRTYEYDIFFAYRSTFNMLDDKLLGHGPSARATDNNVILKVDADVVNDLAFPTFYKNCQTKLSYLIAHEMIHCLQEHRYGRLKFNPFVHPEYWKLEGYPEYIARYENRRGSEYDLVSEINRYIELQKKSNDRWLKIEETGCSVPEYYYKSRLMIEYLMDIRKLTYDEILNCNATENDVYGEMIDWKDKVN